MALLFQSSIDSAERWSAELHRLLPDLEIRVWPQIGKAGEIDVALVWRPPAGLLASLPNLKLIAALGAGVDHVLADPLIPAGVPVVRLVDPYMTAAMSEYVQLQVLRLHRQDPVYLAQQREHVWRERPQPNAAGRRVGVLGMGELGRDAALKLSVLGFDVAGWSRTERRLPGVLCFPAPEGLRAPPAPSTLLLFPLPPPPP